MAFLFQSTTNVFKPVDRLTISSSFTVIHNFFQRSCAKQMWCFNDVYLKLGVHSFWCFYCLKPIVWYKICLFWLDFLIIPKSVSFGRYECLGTMYFRSISLTSISGSWETFRKVRAIFMFRFSRPQLSENNMMCNYFATFSFKCFMEQMERSSDPLLPSVSS